MKRPCLPLPAVQAATTKILPTICLNIAEPQIFCPPKITRYTVYSTMGGGKLDYTVNMRRSETEHPVIILARFQWTLQ